MSDHIHDEHCGCEDHEHEEQVFVVTDDEGVEHEMIIVFTFEMENKAYAVLLDRNNPDEDGVIFRIEEDEEGDFLTSIDDEDEWNRAAQTYEKLVSEQS